MKRSKTTELAWELPIVLNNILLDLVKIPMVLTQSLIFWQLFPHLVQIENGFRS